MKTKGADLGLVFRSCEKQVFLRCGTIQYINSQGVHVQRRMVLVVNIFVFLKLLFFCFVDAIFDLVHDVEATFPLPQLLTASGNLF